MKIDLNCDLGEGFPLDAELMPLITSANVCCGFHAGDVDVVAQTLVLTREHGVRVGAHPSYLDREGFGRREQDLPVATLLHHGVYQVGALAALARSLGLSLSYLKPHGALYNQANRELDIATVIVQIARQFELPVVGLPGSALEQSCRDHCVFIPEGFADRRYQPDGTLVPRTQADAFVHDPDEAVLQAERLLREGRIRTLCVHGDNPQALIFVRTLRAALVSKGILVEAFG